MELPVEEAQDAVHVPLEQRQGVGVLHRDHLRKVDEGDGAVVVHHDVELVEVAVHQPEGGDGDQVLHDLPVHEGRVGDVLLGAPTQRGPVHLGHHHGVPVVVDGLGHREAAVAEGPHEGELLLGRQPVEVEPGEAGAAPQVVALALDGAERRPAQPVELDDERVPLLVLRLIHVRLLPHPDLPAQPLHHPAAHQRPQRQVVVPLVRQPVPVVLARVVVHLDGRERAHAVSPAPRPRSRGRPRCPPRHSRACA